MPVQSFTDVSGTPRCLRSARTDTAARAGLRRVLVLGGTLLVAGLACEQMRRVLDIDGLTLVEIGVLVLFSVNVLWIALPAWTSWVGALRLLVRRPRVQEERPLRSRTALLMPLYNEHVARAASALHAMASDLVSHGEGHAFDVFILSDTSDGSIALAEHEAVWELRHRLGEDMAFYYRRRARNRAYKSGNIQEFCQRWGSAYDHLIVLDADSLIEGATILSMVRRMEDDPELGLLQTIPRLYDGTTLLARARQFADRVYGPVLAAGLSWWTGKEGNFWGHNAILRTRAFMQAAGLPELPGKPPFGGAILSHDFVEAALLRRAGWSVKIADDLDGSYETCPSTLIDLSMRDRRWCQGNLQHLRVLTCKGLHWVSRLHLLTGIFAFVSSPLWLLFLLTTLALGVQNEFSRPEYFTHGYTLFPLWPHLDPVRAVRVLLITFAILALPKLVGSLTFAARPGRVRAAGGLLFPVNVVCEIILSALIAPILMLMHGGFVAEVLAGRDGGWRPQRRQGRGWSWSQVAVRHRWHTVLGLLLAAAGLSISWEMLAWLSPAVLGMVAAWPLSLITGSPCVGRWAKRLGLLRTPEESRTPGICLEAERWRPIYEVVVSKTPDLASVLCDGERLRRHLALVDPPPPRWQEPIRELEAIADLKIRNAADLDDCLARLTSDERAYVLGAPDLLLALARLPRSARRARA